MDPSPPSHAGFRRLQCLIEGEYNVFTVTVENYRQANELKKVIHSERALDTIKDPQTLDLCKANIDLEKHGDNHSLTQLKADDNQQLTSWRSILYYWPEQPPDDHLHVMVKKPPVAIPQKRSLLEPEDIGSDEEWGKRHKADSSIVDDGSCYAKFKFDRVRYDNSPNDSILRFYERFWGVPLPQEHISLNNSIHDPNDEENDEENGEENGDDVLPAAPPPIIDTEWKRLLIRAEYLRIYKWVEDMYTVGDSYRPPAVVVTGQPGIGKSLWVYYVLRRRLGEKSVSLWWQGSEGYLFCSEGVLVVPDTFRFNRFRTRVWTIIDAAQSPSGIPSTLTYHILPSVFPIYITSPQPNRWSGITQSWAFLQVIMNPWTRAEIEYATNILYSNQGPHDALQRYDSLGPTARFCFELSPYEVARHISERNNAINNTSPDLLKRLFSNSSQLSLNTFSHKICLIRRARGSALGDAHVTTDLISDAVEQQVVQRLEEFNEDQLLDMWTNFSKFGDARGMTGSIFEAFVHRRFRTRIHLDATPMVRSNRANSRWYASFSTKRPQSAVHGVAQQVFSLEVDVGSTFVYNTTAKLSIKPDVYYIPRSGQQVALDSFILHGGYLNIFQCTGSDNHDIKGGIDDLLTSCSGLPPRTNWRFVFVIPDDLDSFSCPASSDSVVKGLGLYTALIPMSRGRPN